MFKGPFKETHRNKNSSTLWSILLREIKFDVAIANALPRGVPIPHFPNMQCREKHCFELSTSRRVPTSTSREEWSLCKYLGVSPTKVPCFLYWGRHPFRNYPKCSPYLLQAREFASLSLQSCAYQLCAHKWSNHCVLLPMCLLHLISCYVVSCS